MKEINIATKTRSMVGREGDGLPAHEPKPEGVDMVSYSVFYESIFELADAEHGRTGEQQLMHSFVL